MWSRVCACVLFGEMSAFYVGFGLITCTIWINKCHLLMPNWIFNLYSEPVLAFGCLLSCNFRSLPMMNQITRCFFFFQDCLYSFLFRWSDMSRSEKLNLVWHRTIKCNHKMRPQLLHHGHWAPFDRRTMRRQTLEAIWHYQTLPLAYTTIPFMHSFIKVVKV